jgi:phage gpG-like protein
MIGIDGLHDFLEALTKIDLAPIQQAALGAEAAHLARSVKDGLSARPGANHSMPWVQTGQLRDSIVTMATARDAVVGSTDPVAVEQEFGTRAAPPRPFLAPVGSAQGHRTAHNIAETIVAALREALR